MNLTATTLASGGMSANTSVWSANNIQFKFHKNAKIGSSPVITDAFGMYYDNANGGMSNLILTEYGTPSQYATYKNCSISTGMTSNAYTVTGCLGSTASNSFVFQTNKSYCIYISLII
jgi:hypothetical protein